MMARLQLIAMASFLFLSLDMHGIQIISITSVNLSLHSTSLLSSMGNLFKLKVLLTHLLTIFVLLL